MSPLAAPFALALAAIAAGCAATGDSTMMTAPVAYKDERVDLTKTFPTALTHTQVPVFFATNRKPTGDAARYGTSEADRTRLGVATVGLGPAGWTWEQLVASDATSTNEKPRLARIEGVEEAGVLGDGAAERAYLALIDARLARSPNKEAVFYVHGYRVPFVDVMATMGSFAHYLGHGGAMTVFSWPTGSHFWNYLTDCPRAEKYIPGIADTIELLARSQAKHINLIAYSCGSPLLAEAIVTLRNRHPGESLAAVAARYRLGNVIFVASDIDLKTFARDHVPTLLGVARQVVVYVSENDGALKWSSRLSGGSRLGRPDIAELTREDIERLATSPNFEAIDVTRVRGPHEMGGGMKGHGYWYANDWISTDVLLLMRFQLPPARRGLVPLDGRKVWTIPPDYPKRVSDAVLEARPDARRK